MPRILLILAWPLVEIGLFVVIGGAIGLWPTLAWVVLTAVVGIVILKFQAARGAQLLRSGAGLGRAGGIPADAPVTGLMRGLAAVLLILPGFLTDALGLLLLLPPVQALMKSLVLARISVMGNNAFAAAMGQRPTGAAPTGPAPTGSATDTIDGEWVEVPPEANRNRPSRWTEIK